MKCVIGSILKTFLHCPRSSEFTSFYLARHPASRKKISCVKLNSWLIWEYFHYSLFHWKLNDADHPHFILKIPEIIFIIILNIELLKFSNITKVCFTYNKGIEEEQKFELITLSFNKFKFYYCFSEDNNLTQHTYIINLVCSLSAVGYETK